MTSRREMLADDPSGAGGGDAPRPEDEALVKLTGTMKWFDATRGFGFLVSEQAKGDVLVHFSVLKEHDRRSLPEGAIVECLVADQERGLQARKILSIDLSRAVVPDAARPRSSTAERVDPSALLDDAGEFEPVQPPQGLRLPRPRPG
jgi:cold shock protein